MNAFLSLPVFRYARTKSGNVENLRTESGLRCSAKKDACLLVLHTLEERRLEGRGCTNILAYKNDRPA